MSVSFSAPRSRARLKKTLAEFGVGIENGAARERERELEAVDRITGIQRGQEITARERGRVFCRWIGGRSTAPRPISNVNVREGIT